jgi:hypothetical protein
MKPIHKQDLAGAIRRVLESGRRLQKIINVSLLTWSKEL